MRKAYVPLILLLALSACSGNQTPSSNDTASTKADRRVVVTIEVTDPEARVVASRNVVCLNTNGGSHPDPEGACAVLQSVDMNVFTPKDEDTMCTDQIESNLTGNIRGEIGGEDIDADFALNNGCEIARWHALDGVWFDPLSSDILTN